MTEGHFVEVYLCSDGSVRYYQVGRTRVEVTYSQALAAFRLDAPVVVKFDCPRSDLWWYESSPSRFLRLSDDHSEGPETPPRRGAEVAEKLTIV